MQFTNDEILQCSLRNYYTSKNLASRPFNTTWTTTSCIEQVYRRRYESRRSSKPKLHFRKKHTKVKYGEKQFSIWRMEFLHPAMWHVALGTWQWLHQVAAPCNVIRGSGMTCHWICPNVHYIAILHLVSISTISPQSTCRSAPVCEILSKKWRYVDFQDGGSQPSWILGVQ